MPILQVFQFILRNILGLQNNELLYFLLQRFDIEVLNIAQFLKERLDPLEHHRL